MESNLPLRIAVRVIIHKEDKICICSEISDDGLITRITFPGGGVEEGDNKETTAIKECLEEVGILIKNPQSMDLITTYSSTGKSYRAVENHYYRAEYDRMDKTLYGNGNDAMDFSWVSIEKAIDLIKIGPKSIYTEYKLKALNMLLEYSY